MARKKAEAVEWAQLRMEGQPLLVSSALGPSQLFWVACRTSPYLVQVFEDGQLLSVWRFPEEPVHLLLGPAPENKLKEDTIGLLVVITEGGRVWQIPMTSSTCSTQRPFKKKKEDERPVVPGTGTSKTSEWSIFEDIDMYEDIHISPANSQGNSFAKEKVDASSTSLQINLKHLYVSTSRNNSRAVNTTIVNSENLLGVIPGASIATFGSEGSLVISTTSGSLEILQMGARQHKSFPASSKGQPVCLLFASLLDDACSVMSNGGLALLQSKLFRNFFCCQPHKHVLLEGYMDGKVYATPVDSLEPMALSAVLIADIQQPIVALLTGQLNQTGLRHSNLQAGDMLVIVGQNGRVLTLSGTEDIVATETNPFLHSRRFFKTLDAGLHRLELEGMDLRDWKIKAPVISACMLGSQGLCYCAGSEVFFATLFDNAGSQEVSSSLRSKVAIRTLRESLEPRKVPLADVIVNVAGKGAFGSSPGRSLVALTSRGRLLCVDVSEHSLLPAEKDGSDNGDYCRTWSTPKATMVEKIKELLELISEFAKYSESIQRDERAISFAIHEMAAALRLAFDVASIDKVVQQVTNRLHKTSGLQCTLSVAYCPPALVPAEKLSFGNNANPELIPFNSSLGSTRFTITLYNHSGSPVSAYWSILLELRSILHSKPVAQFSNVINNGCGLPVDGHCSLEFEIRSCETWEPVLASIYLCHVHDFHELEVSTGLQEPSGPDAETLKTLQMSGASCALLAQYRIDILSMLRLPEKLYNPRLQMVGAACESEVAGVFGAFSGCLDVETAEDFKCENAEHISMWRKLNMEHLLEKGSISKDGRVLRFCAPDGGSVCISCSNGAGSTIRVHFQSSSLLLGCLVREALLNHMNQSGIDISAGSDFTGFEEISRKVENIAGQMQALTEVCNQLSSDNIASLLSDSWRLTEDLLQCYTAARTARLHLD